MAQLSEHHESAFSHQPRQERANALLEKEVQVRAYELYEQRGKGDGFAVQDWLAAEAEVLARFFSPLR